MSDQSARGRDNQSPEFGEKTKKRLLVCDDEEDILYVLENVLRRKHNVLTAKTGRDCLRIVSEESGRGRNIDLLLLDYKLGDMSADFVIEKLNGKARVGKTGMKILLISAFELDHSAIDQLVERKLISGHLSKPFGVSELEAAVAKMLS